MKPQIFVVLTMLCLVAIAYSDDPAQTPSIMPEKTKELLNPLQEEAWKKIAAYDQQIWASHLNWSRTSVFFARVPPLSAKEKQEMIAKSEVSSIRYGFTPESAKSIAEGEARIASEGATVQATLDVVFLKGVKKALLTTQMIKGVTRDVNYSDGVIEGHFDSSSKDNSSPFEPWSGTISTDQNVAMSDTAPHGHAVLLMLSPVLQAFPRKTTSLKIVGDVIQLMIISSDTKNSDPMASRLNLSRLTGAPLSLQKVKSVTGRVVYTTEVKKWRNVQGISVPEQIVSYWPSGSAEKYDMKYQLNSAKLNDAVDTDALLLPPGIEVTDWRLGEEKTVNYRIKDGKVPSKSKVETLLGEQSVEPKTQLSNAQNDATPKVWNVIAGMSLILVGASLLLATKNRKQ